MLKRFYISLAIFAILGIVVFAVVFGVTNSLVVVADGFFAELSRGDYEAAYGYLSAEFHDNTSVAELQAFAQDSALAGYADAVWLDRSIYGDDGYLDGEVETADGEYIPVEIFLLRENGSWKIYQIDWYSEDREAGEVAGGEESAD